MKTRRQKSKAKLNLAFTANQPRAAKSSRPGGVRLAPIHPHVMRSGC